MAWTYTVHILVLFRMFQKTNIWLWYFVPYFMLISHKMVYASETDGVEINNMETFNNWPNFQISGSGAHWTRANGVLEAGYDEGAAWLLTPPLNYSFSGPQYLDVDAAWTSCPQATTCDSLFSIQYMFNDTEQLPRSNLVEARKAYVRKYFTSIYNFTSNGTKSTETFRIDYRAPRIRLGIQIFNSSWKVYRMRLYYYYCDEKITNNIHLARTDAATNVTASCSNNSEPVQGGNTNITVQCFENGTWGDVNNQCSCLVGFEPREYLRGCFRCQRNHYKPEKGNNKCTKCPSNWINNNNYTKCHCEKDYYYDKPDGNCYSLPPEVPDLKLRQLSETSLAVNWKQPAGEFDGLLRYDISCYHCKTSGCDHDSPCEGEEYSPGRENLTMLNLTISHLKPNVTYRIEVYSKLHIGQKVPENKWNKASEKITLTKDKKVGETESGTTLIIIVSAACFALLVIVLILIVVITRSRRNSRAGKGVDNNGFTELPEIGREQRMYIDPSNYDDPETALKDFAKEISPKSLRLEKVLGGGEFGDVYKGNLTLPDNTAIPVAAKTLKHDSDERSRKDFFLEASAMGQFQDPNVIKLEGIITKSIPHMILTEYMSNGSLDHFLKQNDGKLTDLQMVGMTRGVASGMKYLAAMNFVHRDIAARNILVNDTLVCKVADFGLSRELETADSSMGEYCTSGGKIPVRWTAPEAIKYRKFSTASDVWSYGILLWEIMTFGDRPYWDWDNFKVMERVDEGFRLPSPKNCPRKMHALMLRCWEQDRGKRPQFSDILTLLNDWIRSPELITDDDPINSLPHGVSDNQYTPIKEWLDEIRMSSYMPHFTAAGYENLSELAGLIDGDLKEIGITLVGHRNKMLRKIRTLPITTEEQRMVAWKRAKSLKV